MATGTDERTLSPTALTVRMYPSSWDLSSLTMSIGMAVCPLSLTWTPPTVLSFFIAK